MTDKYGDIARSLGCEVTEEVVSLRELLVKEAARNSKLERKIERLKKVAQEMYTDVAQHDPCNHCVEWIKQYPWLKE